MRTTISIEPGLIKKIKEIASRDSNSITKTIGELLKIGLKFKNKEGENVKNPLNLFTKNLGAKIDIFDKEELYKALDSK